MRANMFAPLRLAPEGMPTEGAWLEEELVKANDQPEDAPADELAEEWFAILNGCTRATHTHTHRARVYTVGKASRRTPNPVSLLVRDFG